jgi:hypothetical protein
MFGFVLIIVVFEELQVFVIFFTGFTHVVILLFLLFCYFWNSFLFNDAGWNVHWGVLIFIGSNVIKTTDKGLFSFLLNLGIIFGLA